MGSKGGSLFSVLFGRMVYFMTTDICFAFSLAIFLANNKLLWNGCFLFPCKFNGKLCSLINWSSKTQGLVQTCHVTITFFSIQPDNLSSSLWENLNRLVLPTRLRTIPSLSTRREPSDIRKVDMEASPLKWVFILLCKFCLLLLPFLVEAFCGEIPTYNKVRSLYFRQPSTGTEWGISLKNQA